MTLERSYAKAAWYNSNEFGPRLTGVASSYYTRYMQGEQVAIQPLITTTGSVLADRIVQGMINVFEHVFPQHLCAAYVEGSYADGSAVATSDLDVILVFHVPLTTRREQEVVADLISACQDMSALELDITLTDLPHLQQSADPMFKLGARLLYGRDIRETIPLMPMVRWSRQRMHAAFWLTIHVFQRPQPVAAPLTFPNPDDPFYGYAARPIQLPDGTTIPTTRNLIRVTGWIATARIAYEAQEYVVRKRACVSTYRETIGDGWSNLLDTIDQRCRQTWQYRIPGGAEEQAELRAIAMQVLAFENHFLGVYRQFLLDELSSADDTAQTSALAMLKRTWLSDSEILDAVDRLTTTHKGDIGIAAQHLIKRGQDSSTAPRP